MTIFIFHFLHELHVDALKHNFWILKFVSFTKKLLVTFDIFLTMSIHTL